MIRPRISLNALRFGGKESAESSVVWLSRLEGRPGLKLGVSSSFIALQVAAKYPASNEASSDDR